MSIQKILIIIYYSFIKLKNFLIFTSIKVFYAFGIYIFFLDHYYLLLIHHLNTLNKNDTAKKISNFFILKKSNKIFNLMFLHAYFANIGDEFTSEKLNYIFLDYKKVISKILKVEKIIFITPEYYNKIGHFICVGFFIKAIKLNLINFDKIYIVGPKTNYNPSLLKSYLKHKEVKFVEREHLDKRIRDNLKNLTSYLDYSEVQGRVLPFEEFASFIMKCWGKNKNKKFFEISKKDHSDGEEFLKKYGLNIEKNWYTILHVRNNKHFALIRNSKINDFKKAIKHVTSKGGFVIRIGDNSMTPIKNMKNVIDLTHDKSSPKHFVFLFKYAKFFMLSVSGPGALSTFFDAPAIHLDCAPIYSILAKKNDFILPTMYYSKNKMMTFTQRFNSEYGRAASYGHLKKENIIVKPNSSNEILEATKEIYNCAIVNKQAIESKLTKKIKKEFIKKKINPLNISNVIEKKYKRFFS